MKSLCLFDLDHTLLPLDSDHAWGEFTTQLGWNDPDVFLTRNQAFYQDYTQGQLDIHAYVRFATQAARERGVGQVEQAHAQFMQAVIRPAMRPAALHLVQKHRQQGDTLVVITATNELVTRPIADAFGIQHLVATELARDASGWINGEIAGTPCLGAGKVVRLQQWLQARGLQSLPAQTTFYSDSINDLPLLEKVDHPVATNPDDKLRAQALARGWPILELFANA